MRGVFSVRNLWIAGVLGMVVSGGHGVMAATPNPAAKETVSSAMAVPLKKAELFMKEGKYAQANAAIREAQTLPHQTAYEQAIIEKLRIALAIKQNDLETAFTGYERLIQLPRTTASEKVQMRMTQASLAYRARQYAKAIQFIQHYFAEGGSNPHMTTLLIQSYFLNNNYKEALQSQQRQIDEEIRSNRVPAESQWQIMANCQEKLGDQDGLRHSYIELATHYPKAEYWAHVMATLTASKGLSPLMQLEIARFRYESGLIKTSDAYMEMAELATQAGLPHLGLKIISEGYSKGILGVDQNTPRVIRLRTFIQKYIQKKDAQRKEAQQKEIQQKQQKSGQNLAKAESQSDGSDLFMIGYDQVFANNGQAGNGTEGLALMQKAMMQKKTMPHPEEVKLHYAMAQLEMNQKNKAIQTLRTVQGQGIAKELANLWMMKLQAGK